MSTPPAAGRPEPAALVYSAITSVDGYLADEDGEFDWAEPDAEVHAFVNDELRGMGTHLYGRRLYEVMTWWETSTDTDDVIRDFAGIWRAADKVVYSRTLDSPSSARTRIEQTFDPTAVRALKAAADRDILIGGADLAGQALAAGLVDEVRLYVVPVVVGGGTAALPATLRADLDLVDLRRFAGGTVFLRYRVRHAVAEG